MTVTLITGTSKGIGKATALHLARQGYHVFASMRNPERDAAPLLDVALNENLNLEAIQLDVTDAQSCERSVESILKKMGRLDVLINNAGTGVGGAIEDVSEEDLRAVFEANYFGAMRLMRLVIPSMREAQSGAVVNISSIMGVLARAGASAYAGSKFALEAASECLAQEVRRFNIRVAIIEPGVVKTLWHEQPGDPPDPSSPYRHFDERNARLFGALIQRPAQPIQVAEAIQHALETDSPKLRYLVGDDAVGWAAGRRAMTDEEWVDIGREMSLDEFATLYRTHFNIEM